MSLAAPASKEAGAQGPLPPCWPPEDNVLHENPWEYTQAESTDDSTGLFPVLCA